tara:strand:- start:657 stop:995 length:339 start_codon:yes stop_codon:yes gene_type:complete
MSNKSIMVVANLIQLSRGANGEFIMNPEQGVVLRTNVKPRRTYVEQMNRSAAGSGKLYVIDEEATAKNEALILERKKSDDAIDDAVLAGEEIIEAIVVAKTKKKAAKKVKKD